MPPSPALDRLRILDLTTGLTGAIAVRQLAAFGAGVIRLAGADEPAPGFTCRLLHLDPDIAAARGVLARIAGSVDLIVEDRGPGWMGEIGLDWPELSAARPSLVHLAIDSGTCRAEPLLQARSGLMPPAPDGAEPGVALHFPAFAMAAGLHVAGVALAALAGLARGDGRGSSIAVDPRGTIAGLAALDDGCLRGTLVLRTNDQPIAVMAGSDAAFAQLCALLNLQGMREDFRYRTADARALNRETLILTLEKRTITRSASRWLDLCDALEIAAAAVEPLDPLMPSSPAAEDATAEILLEQGYRLEELVDLERRGVIAAGSSLDSASA